MKNLRLSYSCVTTSVFARRLVLGLLVALFPVIHLGWDARSFAASRLSITTEPASQTVTSGQSATFTVVATGHNPHYQWLKNGVAISGANLPSYTTPPTTSSDNGAQFDVVVSIRYNSITSSTATLTVNAALVPPTITTQPVNQTVTAGQTATFSVVANGSTAMIYQWQKNGASIAGATSSRYTTPATTTADSGSTFAVVVGNAAGNAASATATLTVNALLVRPTITTQPVNQTVTAGQTATFSVAASGSTPMTYQWRKNGASIAGATSSSYKTPATTTADNGVTFAVVASNAAGNATSTSATLTVNSAPAPAIQLSSTSISFANDVVNAPASQALVITNSGTATLSISQISATGAPFSVSGFLLPLNVNAGQKTTVTVTFSPTSAGTVSGSLSIVSNAPTSPSSVSLSGSAVAATHTLSISPTSLSFGNVTTGTSSATQAVTITNTGNSSVIISSITLSGTGYSMSAGGSPVTLTPSQALTLSVSFDPTAAGAVNGSISVASNASGSPATVSLSGTGVRQNSVALAWNASTSAAAGYNVYRSTVSGSAYVMVNSAPLSALTYRDSAVQSGTTYYYVVTALDSSGNESVYSNQVSAAIP